MQTPLLLASVLCLSLTVPGQAYSDFEDTKAQIKQGFKEAGKAIADTTRPPRMAIKKGAKKGAKTLKRGAKKGAKAVKKGAKNLKKRLE